MTNTSFLTGLIFAALLAVSPSSAGPWKIDINANLTTALNSYTDNWTGGEAGSFTWGSQFLGVAEKQLSEKLNTKATLKLQFGQTKIQDKTTKIWSIPQKSSDLIDGEELLRLTLGGWVDPFISARVISQFLDGGDLRNAKYGNPVDVTEALGVSRTLEKTGNLEWAARCGCAARQLIDRKNVDTTVTNDGGFELNSDLKASNAQKWVSLLSNLNIYAAVVSSQAESAKGTPAENYWRYPHVKWDNTLTLTFAKYLMLNLSAYMLYDRNISSHARLKETFSAGVTYIYAKK